VRLLTAAGFVLTDVVEPEWPEHLERSWGGWSPLRGRQIPGTAIFVTRLGLGRPAGVPPRRWGRTRATARHPRGAGPSRVLRAETWSQTVW
jgi:hypothetical protein